MCSGRRPIKGTQTFVLDEWDFEPDVSAESDFGENDENDEDEDLMDFDASKAVWSMFRGGTERKDLTWCLDISHREVVGIPGAPAQSHCCSPWTQHIDEGGMHRPVVAV